MYYIGVDFGGTKIAVGLVNENGDIICKESIPTLRERPYQEIFKDMAVLTLKVIERQGADKRDIKSIGIGCPGATDNKEGTLVYATNLYLYNVPMRDEIHKYIDLPVILDNDANCAALAESVAGAAKGVKNSVTITLGTGVGSGVVIDGKIYSGFNYVASEMGHMVIIAGGEECACGRRGCWETYASATALINQTKKAMLKNPDSLIYKLIDGDLTKIDAKVAFDAAKQGDRTGKSVVAEYIGYIAEGLVNVVNIFQPEVLVIGGGVCKEGDYLLTPLRKYVKEYSYCKGVAKTDIRIAQMGNDAGIVGAAMLGK